MKALATTMALLAASAALAVGPAVPPLTGPVVDRADIVDAGNRQRIDTLARDLERRTGAEMAVLTMPSVAPLTAFDYGMQVADTWKLGEKGRDDGLLMLVVLEPREVRIFPGYGLEDVLPDGRVGAILDEYVVPEFKRGAYGDGIYAGLAAAAAIIAGDAPPRAPPRETGRGVPVWVVVAAFAALLVLLLLFSDPGGPSSFRGARRRGYPSLPYGGPFPGPRLPGGFGGGFGGGGGGFGGGGAGRSW